MIKPRSHAPFAPVPTGLVGAIRLPPFQVSSFILLNSSRRSTVDPRLTALKLPLRTAGQGLIKIGHLTHSLQLGSPRATLGAAFGSLSRGSHR